MEIKILYLGMLAEKSGVSSEVIRVDDGTSVGQLKTILEDKYRGILSVPVKIAVNQKIAHPDDVLAHGQEVALLPPYAGG